VEEKLDLRVPLVTHDVIVHALQANGMDVRCFGIYAPGHTMPQLRAIVQECVNKRLLPALDKEYSVVFETPRRAKLYATHRVIVQTKIKPQRNICVSFRTHDLPAAVIAAERSKLLCGGKIVLRGRKKKVRK